MFALNALRPQLINQLRQLRNRWVLKNSKNS